VTDQPSIGVRDLVAFLCELAMLALLVAAGHGLANGWRGWALGIFLALVAIGIWSQWMAPTSARRLENPRRYVVQVMLFLTVGLYAAAGGLTWWGIGFAVAAIATFGSLVRTDR
jgi:hypothetical protein